MLKTFILGVVTSLFIVVAPASAVTFVDIDPGDSFTAAYGTKHATGTTDIAANTPFTHWYEFVLPDLTGVGSVNLDITVAVIDGLSGGGNSIKNLLFEVFEGAALVASLAFTDANGDAVLGTPQSGILSAFAGTYDIKVTGTALSLGGAYSFSVAAVPLPAALPLLLGGIGLLGVAGYRRRRAVAA